MTLSTLNQNLTWRVSKLLNHGQRGTGVGLINTVHRRKDGSLYPVEINLQIFDYGGEKLCLALVVDLTEHRAMKEELQEKEATLSAIMDSARDAIVMLDGQGNVTFWNLAAEQLFGYSREEILGKDMHRLVVPDEPLQLIIRLSSIFS